MYVVKMDGEKVRPFKDLRTAKNWADIHCRGGKVEIVKLAECGELPRASSRIYPNEDMASLVYKPFVAVV